MGENSIKRFIIAVVTAAVFTLTACAAKTGNSEIKNGGELQKVSESTPVTPPLSATDSNSNGGIAVQLIQHVVEGNGYSQGVEISVKLGNGYTITKSYDELCRNPYLLHSDLTGDGIAEIVLALPEPASNYNATDVHVLSITGNELKEILTVLSNQEQSASIAYQQTLYKIPNPPDSFGLESRSDYTDFCTGVSIVYFSGQASLKIRHLEGENTPYSILSWDGIQWIVAEQAVSSQEELPVEPATLIYSLDDEWFQCPATEIPYYQRGMVTFLTSETIEQNLQGHQPWLESPIEVATSLCSNFISGHPFSGDDILLSNAYEFKTKDGFHIKVVSDANDIYIVDILTPDIGSLTVTMKSPYDTPILFITKIEYRLM